jgi:hypothetical protein
MKGGGCGCGMQIPSLRRLVGGSLPALGEMGTCNGSCNMGAAAAMLGGARRSVTRMTRRVCKGAKKIPSRVAKTLRKWVSGKSIGFSATSSLKARGLIPRARGNCKVSKKYM